jgi:hypothetical protein
MSDATIRFNAEKNGIEVKHPQKPAQEVIDELKRDGFRWGKTNKCWYIKDTPYNREKAAKYGALPELKAA